MNFQNLQKIEKPDVYINIAFNNARVKTSKLIIRKTKSREEKLLIICREKIKRFGMSLNKQLSYIVENFPKIGELSEFYQDLCKISFDVDKLKKALYSLKWSTRMIEELTNKYHNLISKTKKIEIEKEYYGRTISVVKKLLNNLEYIEKCRKIMKDFPSIKTDLFTVAIAGFPNVGKSTLLSKITTAKPEIKNYYFTTKNLNLGYVRVANKKIQFIDTPGTLNRLDKMNNIEKQAYLVMKTVANAIIYIFDPTEQYPIKDQELLLEKIKEYNKPVFVYISKTDIIRINKKRFFNNTNEIYTDTNKLLLAIEKECYEKDLKAILKNS
ncbi:MAG: GTPase [Candidatus Woesearchaeota archaeon]